LFLLSFLDEADNSIDNILFCDVLYLIFGPIEGEKAHALDGGVVGTLSACTVDDMGDLIEGEPLDVLDVGGDTCAMASSPMKMQSVIFTGMESSSRE